MAPHFSRVMSPRHRYSPCFSSSSGSPCGDIHPLVRQSADQYSSSFALFHFTLLRTRSILSGPSEHTGSVIISPPRLPRPTDPERIRQYRYLQCRSHGSPPGSAVLESVDLQYFHAVNKKAPLVLPDLRAYMAPPSQFYGIYRALITVMRTRGNRKTYIRDKRNTDIRGPFGSGRCSLCRLVGRT